jgi:hypothetical protein
VSEVASRSKPKLYGVSISASRVELSKAVSSVWPVMHERSKGNGFRGNAGEDIKGMSRDNVGEVRDYSNAVPGIGSLIGRSVNRRCGMRKNRGRVRT